jgi:ABC-type multidrug transport system fused ATPase/permease subunit
MIITITINISITIIITIVSIIITITITITISMPILIAITIAIINIIVTVTITITMTIIVIIIHLTITIHIITIITICTVAQTLCIFLYRKPQGGSEMAQGPGIVVEEGNEALDCTIRFQNVKFSYPSRPKIPVLKGFTVTFPPKKFTCVIGNSGSGKSTLLMLILRMYARCNCNLFIYAPVQN